AAVAERFDPLVDPQAAVASTASTAASAAAVTTFFMLPSSEFSGTRLRRRMPSFVCLVCARSRIAGGLEDGHDPHRLVAAVLERMDIERRQVDATARRDRPVLPIAVQDALPLEDVDHLVVNVAVIRCPAWRDHAVELRHIAAAELFRDEVAELAVAACRQQRLVGKPDRPRAYGRRSVRLRRDYRDGQQVLRPPALDLVRLAGGQIDARAGLELVGLIVYDEPAAARRGVEDLLDALQGSRERAARVISRHVELEQLRACARVDRDRPRRR